MRVVWMIFNKSRPWRLHSAIQIPKAGRYLSIIPQPAILDTNQFHKPKYRFPIFRGRYGQPHVSLPLRVFVGAFVPS
ncbi:hypothetical protein Ac2012v2_006546 [Leucoagaricus gongylophorus]